MYIEENEESINIIMKNLLIYIPSYNRYEKLIAQLNKLIESVERDGVRNVRILANDNASTDDRYLGLQNVYTQPYISIKRNALNIGLVGNLIRGFEQEGWDYIWLLSDDDIVSSEALGIIAQEVAEGKHDFFYLKCNIQGDDRVYADEVIDSQESYFRKFSSLSMMGLMSANIYSAKTRKHVEYMYLYGYTLFPFLAGVFRVMQSEKFSLKCLGGDLLQWKANRRSYNHIYEMALTNVLFLAELLENKKNRNIFIGNHIKNFGATHFFPLTFKSLYNFKKALTQVGFVRLCLAGGGYVRWCVGRMIYQILRPLKFLFPKAHLWYKKVKTKKQ